MQGMERAKAIRDYLAFAQMPLRGGEVLALKDAADAIKRGEKPTTIESFRPASPEELMKRLSEVGEFTAVKKFTGQLETRFLMSFDVPYEAWAVAFDPYRDDRTTGVYLSLNSDYSTPERITKGNERDGVFWLRDFFRNSETPKAIRARLQLLLNKLYELGGSPQRAMKKLLTELESADSAQKQMIQTEEAKRRSIPVEKTTVKYTDHPVAKKIEAYRKTLSGNLSLENINAVADMALNEYRSFAESPEFSALVKKAEDGAATYAKNKQLIDEIVAKKWDASWDEIKTLEAERSRLRHANAEWRNNEVPRLQAEAAIRMKDFLSTIRASTDRDEDELRKTIIKNPRQHNAKEAIKWMSVYPAEFVDALMQKQLEIKDAKRASYNEYDGVLRLGLKTRPDEVIHEFGHGLEQRCPIILALEAEFYEKRRSNEKYQSLRALTGIKYDKDEIAIKDHYLEPYMGKWYGGRCYELVSMGFEMFFTQPQELMKDEEYFKFILGILLTVTP